MDSSLQSTEELPPQTFKNEERMKNMKNKEFLTSSYPEIHCNFISRVFDPSFSQIKGYLVFKSKSHYYNSNQQVFQGDRIKGSFFCNHKELYHLFINTNSYL